jgi:hypothetical protein
MYLYDNISKTHVLTSYKIKFGVHIFTTQEDVPE